jgi:hypothetical protein
MLSIERRNTRLWHTSNALLRLAVLRGATRPFATNAIVNEYPKSGGTWMSQMLAEALGLPFPRNRLPMLGSCLMQCHVLNPLGMRRVTVVWRDGRDIMVSFYHHLLVGHEHSPPAVAAANRRRAGIDDPADVRANLPRFIEALHEKRLGPSFTWSEFVAVWAGRTGIQDVRYEDLLADPAKELSRVVEGLTGQPLAPLRAQAIAERYSFASQTGRNRGTDGVAGRFLRKGIAGEWRSVFSPEAHAVFNHVAGDALARLGYERGLA